MKYDNLKITILNSEESSSIPGVGLDVINRFGSRAAATDMAIVTGTYLPKTCPRHVYEDESLSGRACDYYLSELDSCGDPQIYKYYDARNVICKEYRCASIRPVINSKTLFDELFPNRKVGYEGTFEVEFGEYPQYAPDEEMQKILNKECFWGKLNKTNKVYTIDKTKTLKDSTPFKPVEYQEYERDGRKYICVKTNTCDGGYKYIQLSNGDLIRNGYYVWIEVKPIVWLMDLKTKKLISKKCLLSGINIFDLKSKKEYKNFKETELYSYLNTYLVKDIIPSKLKLVQHDIEEKDEITLIIDEIKKNLIYSADVEQTKKDVMNIIWENNSKIDDINQLERSGKIELTLTNSDDIHRQTVNKLNAILNGLLSNYNKTKPYYDMLEIIEDSKNVINNEDIDSNDDITNLIKNIINTSIKLLTYEEQAEIKEDLLRILELHENEIKSFLNSTSNDIKYNNLNDFNISVRSYIQEVLIKIRIKQNKDILGESIKDTIDLMNINNEISENKDINVILESINNNKQSITEKIESNPDYYQYYQRELDSLLIFDIDLSSKRTNAYDKLRELDGKLYALNLKIGSEVKRNKNLIKENITW